MPVQSEIIPKVLESLIEDLPDDGVVLDLFCGDGRSTIIMAQIMERLDKQDAMIVAVDNHVSDPMTGDGTITQFFQNLINYRVRHKVIPIVTNIENLDRVFNKRSANLIIVQAPSCLIALEDALEQCIEAAQAFVRRNGRIVFIRPETICPADFRRFIFTRFDDLFRLAIEGDDLLAFDYVAKERL